MSRHIYLCIAFVLIYSQATWAVPTASEIKTILQNRIDTEKRGVGIVVGLIDKNGRTIISHGTFDKSSDKPVDENTVFEIGSITKVFTATVLQDMASRGHLNLDDPISKFVPDGVTAPTKNGKHITLEHLSTHTSGLPRLPDNMDIKDSANPYTTYTPEQMYDFLSNHTLQQEIGQEYVYSNYGAGLLGYILSSKAGVSYEKLVTNHICKPLGLTSTAITLSTDLQSQLATGHNLQLEPVPNWDLPTLAGAGALRSTVNDLLTFLAANLSQKQTPLNETLAKTHIERHPAGKNMSIGLGWHILKQHEPEIIWHNGGTGGYRSFMGFDKKNGRGVVVLTNTGYGCDDIGFHILNEKYELSKPQPKPTTQHTEIELAPATFDTYVGEYELTKDIVFTISRETNRFYVQLTGQNKLEMFPKTENQFFLKIVDAQITFHKNEAGEVTHLVLHQNKVDQRAIKKGMTLELDQTEVSLSDEMLKRYVGQYEVQPGIFFTITQDKSQLKARLSGQPAVEIYPESETRFFYKIVDAQIDFHADEEGLITGLTLHQAGRDIKAKKVE